MALLVVSVSPDGGFTSLKNISKSATRSGTMRVLLRSLSSMNGVHANSQALALRTKLAMTRAASIALEPNILAN